MTGAATATVETLTAEVRVLMVGNRQVTLSVFRQLDRCPAGRMKMFGRVRSDKNLSPSTIEVVGCSLEDDRTQGTLVRDTISKPCWQDEGSAEFNHWMMHHHRNHAPEKYYRLFDDSRLQWKYSQKRGYHDDPICQASHSRPDLAEPEWDSQLGGYRDTEYKAAYDWLRSEYQWLRAGGAFCAKDELRKLWEDEAREQHAGLSAEQSLYDAAEALPLIVLAGLK